MNQGNDLFFSQGGGVSVLHFYIILCAYKRLFKKLINVNSFVTRDIFWGHFFGVGISSNWKCGLSLLMPKVNLTERRELPNPDLSDET